MKIYPVVHITSHEVATQQSLAALDAGADGVYLINHHQYDPQSTLAVLEAVREHMPTAYVGINLLGHDTGSVLDALEEQAVLPNAIWHDDITDSGEHAPAEVLARKNAGRLKEVRLLGGVAFKYTITYTDDPTEAAHQVRALEPVLDVITTSGAGTGQALSVEKLRAMRAAATKPIAIASGVSAENIHRYSGLADEVLVSSSLETEPYSGVFVREALEKIIALAHSEQR